MLLQNQNSFFIFFVYIFIHISANMSAFWLKFSQIILHTEISKQMYNWSFLFVVWHKPTLLPSTFKSACYRATCYRCLWCGVEVKPYKSFRINHPEYFNMMMIFIHKCLQFVLIVTTWFSKFFHSWCLLFNLTSFAHNIVQKVLHFCSVLIKPLQC